MTKPKKDRLALTLFTDLQRILFSTGKINETSEIMTGDTVIIYETVMHHVEGVITHISVSEQEKHVLLVKGISHSNQLFYLKIHHIPIKVDRPQCFSLYINNAASCIIYRNNQQLGIFNNIEVSLCGTSLSHIDFLSIDHKKRVIMDILCELEYIHSQRIIHNDIKLDNIVLYEAEREVQYAKLIDFECSKRFRKYDTDQEVCYSIGDAVLFSGSGTPGYFPPEKLAVSDTEDDKIDIAHSLTPKSDIYSLGIVCLEIILGNHIRTEKEVKEALIEVGKGEMKNMLKVLELMIHPKKQQRPSATTIIHSLGKVWGNLEQEGRKKAKTELTSNFWDLFGEPETPYSEPNEHLIQLENDGELELTKDELSEEEQYSHLKRGRDVANIDSNTLPRDSKKNKP
ncbi:hypothetical protein C9374_001562 [Naegleria lovaniensis]|uniref:Protein kinase domain-containing protein n=1 Tax=Naegleria lovaniensis TaxID=51637 RepID=A0AA88GQW3_NAELO|nr:uncharacterized protein C9374_001562 [Naegleria lovaniensis]KAG2387230.1 hypothetical protein C9374_001562 [Naegleria lovaniensis]